MRSETSIQPLVEKTSELCKLIRGEMTEKIDQKGRSKGSISGEGEKTTKLFSGAFPGHPHIRTQTALEGSETRKNCGVRKLVK